jgi:hypothetical protein
VSNNLLPKKSKQAEINQSLATPVLEYDLIEDLKKLRVNISVFELLKFPLILQKMLQSITENNKNGDPRSKKTIEIGSKTAKKIPNKTTSEALDKMDLAEKMYQM